MRLRGLSPLLALAACATSDTAPAPAEVRTLHLICDKTIALDINHDGASAVVKSATGKQSPCGATIPRRRRATPGKVMR